jgi:hypothetical protein
MKVATKAGLLMLTLVISTAAGAQDTDGTHAFGFRKGATKAEVIALVGREAVTKDEGDMFVLSTAPEPNQEFESYILYVSRTTGVARVVGLTKNVSTNVFGDQLKALFMVVARRLVASYGEPDQKFDFVRPGSNFKEPQDWMRGLLKEERYLLDGWDLAEGVVISEEAVALETDKGYLRVEFEFDNSLTWTKEHELKSSF